MAVHNDHTLAPEIGRRAFLGGTAGALATIAIPAAAMAAGDPAAEPDWQALHDELQALYAAADAADEVYDKAFRGARAARPDVPMIHNLRSTDDGLWEWGDEKNVILFRNHLDEVEMPDRIDAYFAKRTPEVIRSVKRPWPADVADRFRREGERHRENAHREFREWLSACQEAERVHGVEEASEASSAIEDQVDALEKRIRAIPSLSFPAIWLKLAVVQRYDDTGYSEGILREIRDQIAAENPSLQA